MNKNEARLFIVDDTPANTKMLATVVKREGYTNVDIYHDPAIALEELALKKPDLILLDMRMPVIDGLEFLRRIQSEINHTQLAVIVLTASDNEHQRLNALSLGAQDYIEKPINIQETVNRINNVLNLQVQKREVSNEKVALGHQLSASNEAIAELKGTLQAIFSQSSEFVFIVDIDWNIIEANDAAVDTFAVDFTKKQSIIEVIDVLEDLPEASNALVVTCKNQQKQTLLLECKNTPLRIAGDIHHVFIFNDVTKKIENEKRLRLMAETHYISKLPNRYQLMTSLELVQNTLKTNEGLAYMFVSFFENSNILHRYDSSVFTQGVVKSSERLANLIDTKSTAILHWRSDSYLILCSSENVHTLAVKIRSLFDVPIIVSDIKLNFKPSIGYYLAQDKDSTEDNIHNASLASFDSYNDNNAIIIYDRSRQEQREYNEKIELGLEFAEKENFFKLSYQPIIDLNTNTFVSAEALIRWQHPELGYVSPAIFIPMAERTGRIESIGNWVIKQACRDFPALQQKYPQLTTLSINVAAQQFNDGLIKNLKEAISSNNISAQQIKLEVTETSFLDDFEHAKTILLELKALGFKIALDDFGTGFSSLSYLSNLPVDTLKIDRSFIQAVFSSDKSMTLVKSIISMSLALGMEIIAEGIEEEGVGILLRDLGVQLGQGFYYAKPEFIESDTE